MPCLYNRISGNTASPLAGASMQLRHVRYCVCALEYPRKYAALQRLSCIVVQPRMLFAARRDPFVACFLRFKAFHSALYFPENRAILSLRFIPKSRSSNGIQTGDEGGSHSPNGKRALRRAGGYASGSGQIHCSTASALIFLLCTSS